MKSIIMLALGLVLINCKGKVIIQADKILNKRTQECQNPDLNLIVQDQQVLLCDGSIAYGKLVYCNDTTKTNCITNNNYKAINIKNIDPNKFLESVKINNVKGQIPIKGTFDLSQQSQFVQGYYNTITGLPTKDKICQDIYILGEKGLAQCGLDPAAFSKIFPSTISHDKALSQRMSIYDEIINNIKTGYRKLPKITLDNYGRISNANVNPIIRNSVSEWAAGVEKKVCGKSAQTIEDKIQNCKTHNSSVTPWDGATKGNSTEGTWTLVTVYSSSSSLNDGDTCDSSCKEVWRDDRTGLLWSDTIVDATNNNKFNWCHASGSNNKSGSPYAEDDPSNYCDNATYQNQDNPISLCYEDSSWLTTPAWTYDDKGGLHLGSTPQVRWRLPTLYDYFLMILDGGYYVLPNINVRIWTATIYGDDTTKAWHFFGPDADISITYQRNVGNQVLVRCIGH